MDLVWLFCFRCQDQLTFYYDGSANIEFADFIEVFYLAVFKYYLKILEIGTVVQLNKAQILGCTDCLYPSCYSQFLIAVAFKTSCKCC